MKTLLSLTVLLFAVYGYGQSPDERTILKLSNQVFKWEVENKIDSIEKLFHEKFTVVNSAGESKSRKEYLATLRSGSFLHNNIEVEENIATVVNNTATVVGKGKFTVTVSGNQKVIFLSYIEVFTRPVASADWKILAMHATALQH